MYRIVASRSTSYYSRNQKFCFLKSRLQTCPNILFRNKTFFVLKIESWNFQHLIDLGSYEFSFSQNFCSFGQLLFFWAHVTIWVQIQLLTRDVTNQDVLLLATIRYLQHTIYLLENNLNLDLCLEVHILYVRHPLQDLLSSLNTVISTNQSTRFIT